MDLKVKCLKCKREIIIKLDESGMITSNLLYWLINMKELCDECREGLG